MIVNVLRIVHSDALSIVFTCTIDPELCLLICEMLYMIIDLDVAVKNDFACICPLNLNVHPNAISLWFLC